MKIKPLTWTHSKEFDSIQIAQGHNVTYAVDYIEELDMFTLSTFSNDGSVSQQRFGFIGDAYESAELHHGELIKNEYETLNVWIENE